jgi:hypothetical protein
MAHSRPVPRERKKLSADRERSFSFGTEGVTDTSELQTARIAFEEDERFGSFLGGHARFPEAVRAGEFRTRPSTPSRVDPQVIAARRTSLSRQRRLSQGRVKTESLLGLLGNEPGASGSLLGV